MKLEFFVAGVARPAGSKRVFPVRKGGQPTGKFIVTDSSGQKGKNWRGAIHYSAYEAMKNHNCPMFNEPVILRCEFIMPRPRNHYRTGKNSHILRDDAPSVHSSRPDATKLVRQLEDSLTNIAWPDDALVVEQYIFKKYGDQPGAKVVIASYKDEAVLRETMAGSGFALTG